MNILGAYYKKTIDFKCQNKILKFKVSQSLFSSHNIDFGTQRLLRTFVNKQSRFGKILDLGCGYGTIGITLKAINSYNDVHMIDRDALAVEFTKLNVKLNNIEKVQAYGSLGYDDVTEKDFDLIISNIPAKVGKKVLTHMLVDSKYFLKKDGLVAIVVIDGITEDVNEILSDPNINVVFRKSWPGHTVFHYKFQSTAFLESYTTPNSFETGLYDRAQTSFNFLNKIITLKTTFNLPEFNEMSYETQLLMKSMRSLQSQNVSRCLTFNVNQGHIPVALSLLKHIGKIMVVDRNLQSLKTTERNLIFNGLPREKITLKHQVGVSINQPNIDCALTTLNKKEERKVNAFLADQIASQLRLNGVALLVSSSNVITQIEAVIKKSKGIIIQNRIRQRGKSSLSFKKTS